MQVMRRMQQALHTIACNKEENVLSSLLNLIHLKISEPPNHTIKELIISQILFQILIDGT